MLRKAVMVIVSLGFLLGCAGCDAAKIVGTSLNLAGDIVGWF